MLVEIRNTDDFDSPEAIKKDFIEATKEIMDMITGKKTKSKITWEDIVKEVNQELGESK